MIRLSWTKGAAAAGMCVLLTACQSGNVTTETIGSAAPRALAAETALTGDALLAARLVTALHSDPATSDLEIQVSVAQGRARLSGFAGSAAARLRAGALAAETDGVLAVDNRLILRHHAGITQDPLGDARVRL